MEIAALIVMVCAEVDSQSRRECRDRIVRYRTCGARWSTYQGGVSPALDRIQLIRVRHGRSAKV